NRSREDAIAQAIDRFATNHIARIIKEALTYIEPRFIHLSPEAFCTVALSSVIRVDAELCESSDSREKSLRLVKVEFVPLDQFEDFIVEEIRVGVNTHFPAVGVVYAISSPDASRYASYVHSFPWPSQASSSFLENVDGDE
ncbi:hypothetical protein CVT26_010062, partial [Gymnopilus dilepis]